MKKISAALALLVCLMMVLCAGCGGSDAPAAAVSATMAPTAEPTATPEPTAEPTATPEPTEEPVEEEPVEEPEEEEDEPQESSSSSSSSNNSNSNSNSGNSNSGAATSKPQPTEAPVEEVDAYEVAVNMTGSSMSDLIAAIGAPNGSEYTASCLMPTGEDGLHYYDDFTVSTLRYPDGTELVMGAF